MDGQTDDITRTNMSLSIAKFILKGYLFQFRVTASSESADISITFADTFTSSILYNGVTYTAGMTLTETVPAYQSFNVPADADLSGTYITSDVAVAVYGGNTDVSLTFAGVF